jgi:hypothetical protein
MEIEYFYPPTQVTIEEFADQHGLIMEVHQRKHHDYYAHFKNADLERVYGNGITEGGAIKNYARKISGNILVVGREIQVPTLKGN